jgi:integrase
MVKKLTPISIAKIRPGATRREIPDAGKPGLFLVVQPSGKKSWAVRYRFQGKPRKCTLDGFSSLPVAHKQAQAILDAVAEGRDPAAEKREAKANLGAASSDLFKAVAADFVKHHTRPNNRPRYARDVERMLAKDILPAWGERRIHDITKRDVLELLRDIMARGGGLSANRVLSVVKKLFNWSVDQDIISSSPATSVKAPLAQQSRDRILSDDEIRRFWQACEQVPYPFGPLAKLLLLTGQRRDEVARMTWDELDLDERLWTLPATRTKNGRQHAVPLSDAAVTILEAQPKLGVQVFTTDGTRPIGGHSRGKDAIDRAFSEPIAPWIFHDLRRTAASGMAKIGIPVHVTEAVLNHRSGKISGIAAVYNRYDYADEKRDALEAWSRFVLQRPTNNVTRMPQRA